MSTRTVIPETCPVCGVDVPRHARACPGCGADERSGWNEEATRYDGLDLPDEAFGEPGKPGRRLRFPPALWIIVALILVVSFVVALLIR